MVLSGITRTLEEHEESIIVLAKVEQAHGNSRNMLFSNGHMKDLRDLWGMFPFICSILQLFELRMLLLLDRRDLIEDA